MSESKKVFSTETGEKRKRRARNTTQAKVSARRHVDTEVRATTLPEIAMEVARNLAGDSGRVKIQRDGSIIVENI